MLQINAYLAPSGVHGIGLFSAVDLKEGDVVWRFTPRMDLVFSQRQMLRLSRGMDPVCLNAMGYHLYKRGDRFFYLADNTRFINHSETDYNVMLLNDETEVATRDIERGDELLENYYLSYDPDDPFMLEMMQIEAGSFLRLGARDRRRLVKAQNVPR